MRLTLASTVERLQNDVVAIPTETVYGLAAPLSCPEAIEKIFRLKGRPRQNPLIIHVATLEEVEDLTDTLPPDFYKLTTLWPGPLTLVLPAQIAKIPSIVRAGLPTAAFRIPALELTRTLLQQTGPLVAPSANVSGRPSATSAAHVEHDFGRDFPILEGGACNQGLESTILGFIASRWHLLRLGALPAETLAPLLGYLPPLAPIDPDRPACPGQLLRHYAPQAKLLLEGAAEAVLGFQERRYDLPLIPLGSLKDPEEVAHNLYFVLRSLDERGLQSVRLDLDFPTTGLWATLRERLLKAASLK